MSDFSVILMVSPCRRLRFNISDIYPVPRIGSGYLSAYLKKNGFSKVRIWDVIAERKWIPDIINEFRANGAPNLLGIGCSLLSMREGFEIAGEVKRVFPDVKVVIGGPGVAFSKDALFAYGNGVDFFIRGEGEEAMVSLAKTLKSNDGDFKSVPRLVWRNVNGEIVENGSCAFRDLNDGLMPDYDAMPMHLYRLHPPMGVFPPAVMIESARGCSYNCSFCCLTRQVAFKEPSLIEQEIVQLKLKYGIREVHFVDPTFTLDPDRVIDLSSRIKKLDIKWSCKTRVDLVPGELLKVMADSGCYLISFGVETSRDSFLEALKKNVHVRQTAEAFGFCRKFKIRSAAYLMIGCLGESEESVKDNIRFVKELDPDYVLYDVLQADPSNPLTTELMKQGKFSEEDLNRYYLSDDDNWFLKYSLSGESVERTQRWLKKASREFYFRPSYVRKKLFDIRSRQDIFNLFEGASFLMKDFFGIGRLWDKLR